MSLLMFPQETRQHRIAYVLSRVFSKIFGGPHSDRWIKVVPYFHGYREYQKTTKPIHTSLMFNEKKNGGMDKEFKIPAGEKIILYFSRGSVYRFWKGECFSMDTCHEERTNGIVSDMEVWETYWEKKHGRKKPTPQQEWIAGPTGLGECHEEWLKEKKK